MTGLWQSVADRLLLFVLAEEQTVEWVCLTPVGGYEFGPTRDGNRRVLMSAVRLRRDYKRIRTVFVIADRAGLS